MPRSFVSRVGDSHESPVTTHNPPIHLLGIPVVLQQYDDVYVPSRTRLGDTIIGVSNAITLSKKLRRKLRFSMNPKVKDWDEKAVCAVKQRIDAALYLMNHGGYLDIVDYKMVVGYKELHKHPVKSIYENSNRFVVDTPYFACYDLFPTSPTNKFTRDQRNKLLGFLREFDTHDCHDLGNKVGLISTIETMMKCKHFIGSSSGMAVMANALGMDVHLIRQGSSVGRVSKWHAGSSYTLYGTVDDFLDRFPIVRSISDGQEIVK